MELYPNLHMPIMQKTRQEILYETKENKFEKTSYDTSRGSSYADSWDRPYNSIPTGQNRENQHDQGWEEDTSSTRGRAGLYEDKKSQASLMGGIRYEQTNNYCDHQSKRRRRQDDHRAKPCIRAGG